MDTGQGGGRKGGPCGKTCVNNDTFLTCIYQVCRTYEYFSGDQEKSCFKKRQSTFNYVFLSLFECFFYVESMVCKIRKFEKCANCTDHVGGNKIGNC